jgi:hypothetical protein
MTPDLLRSAGEALYGEHRWQGRFSEEFGVHPRTLRRWLSGADAIPPSFDRELYERLNERWSEILDVLAKLGRHIKDAA